MIRPVFRTSHISVLPAGQLGVADLLAVRLPALDTQAPHAIINNTANPAVVLDMLVCLFAPRKRATGSITANSGTITAANGICKPAGPACGRRSQ